MGLLGHFIWQKYIKQEAVKTCEEILEIESLQVVSESSENIEESLRKLVLTAESLMFSETITSELRLYEKSGKAEYPAVDPDTEWCKQYSLHSKTKKKW